MLNKNNNEDGYALILVILILALFSIFSLGMMSTVSANMRIGIHERKLQSAYYISESGTRNEYYEFLVKINDVFTTTNNKTDFYDEVDNYVSTRYGAGAYNLTTFENAYGASPEANILIKKVSGDETAGYTYEIISKGEIDGSTRITTKSFVLKWENLNNPKFAVLTYEKMELGGGKIKGDVGSMSPHADAIKITNDTDLGEAELHVPDPSTGLEKRHWDVVNPLKKVTPFRYNIPDFPQLPTPMPTQSSDLNITWARNGETLELNDDLYVDVFNLGGGATLNIDLKDSDRTIYVNHFTLNGGHINIVPATSTNKLRIYVINKITSGTNDSNLNKPADDIINDTTNPSRLNKEIEKLNIYYEGTDPITLGGAQKIFGSVYVKDAEVNIGAGSGLRGNLISLGENKRVNIDGGSVTMRGLIFAPKGDVHMSGGAMDEETLLPAPITSPIIARNFYSTANTEIIYDPDVAMPGIEGGSIITINTDDLVPSETPIREQ